MEANGGEFLKNLFSTGDFTVLNNLEKSDKGPWTWIDRKENNIKSFLDNGTAMAALVPHVVNIQVDRERKYTPSRVIKHDMVTKKITDNFSLKIELG